VEPISETTVGAVDQRPDDFVQSVSRAVRLLEVVGERPGLPVKTIARRSGLNISTTYHLVRTLAYEGYLLRLPDGTYVLGDAVARRFHDLLRSFEKPPRTTVVLRHLAERTGLSAYLGCLSAGRLTVVEVVEGPGSPYLEDFESGLEVSAHATALGKALLSALPRRERRPYLTAQGLRPFTVNTCTDVAQLESTLTAIQPRQPVMEHGEFRDGVACAAGVVPSPADQGSRWAVAVSTRQGEVPARVRAELMLAADDLVGSTR
jgi:DNA-binding IclR family transcriptional regulator